MIGKSKTSDALAVMAAANPVSARGLAEVVGRAEVEVAMARALALGERASAWESLVSGSGGHKGGRRFGAKQTASKHRRAAVGLGLVGAGAISALLIFSGWLAGGRATHPEFAAGAIEVAKANPRLLVSMPGWQIVRADEFEPDEGELTFSDGRQQLELHWYPARQYESFLTDRSSVSKIEAGTLLGQRATTVDYGREEYATMLSPQGEVFIEVRGRLGDKAAYGRILHSLRPVDIDTWLSAMPASTVRPAARSAAVTQMLRGIPLPPTFDAASLQGKGVDLRSGIACGQGGQLGRLRLGAELDRRPGSR